MPWFWGALITSGSMNPSCMAGSSAHTNGTVAGRKPRSSSWQTTVHSCSGDGKVGNQPGHQYFVVDGGDGRELLPSILKAKPLRNDIHPTMKPVALIERMLANSARRGDIVLDPFGGSGSTLMACDRLGMKASCQNFLRVC